VLKIVFPKFPEMQKQLVLLLQEIIAKAPQTYYGTGSPESVTVGNIGDLYINKSGGAGVTLYVKESGTGTNTGWVAK
jgi:hypothetical protein